MTVLHLVGLLEVRRRRDVGPRVMVGIGGWGEGDFNVVLSVHATLSAVEKVRLHENRMYYYGDLHPSPLLGCHRHCPVE